MTSKRQAGRNGAHVALVSLGSEVVRCGVGTMLRELDALDDVVASGSFDHSMELLHSGRPTLLVLNYGDEPRQAEKLASTATGFGVRVLLMLRSATGEALAQVAAVPADGYLLEPTVTHEVLVNALGDLDSGLVPIPHPVARKLLAEVGPVEPAGPEPVAAPAARAGTESTPLTDRELEALTLMVEGLSNKQIARRLGISEHGAKRHVANILAKLNCSNRTLAAAVALSRGLVRDPGTSRRARR
ncbi:helix-turn-helix transcriptional regulator [Actinomadura latina]|uniref:Response regulator transcription factor n=1 Tax=Actinomadura latina TaxID=163603 RepID=A0A846ZAS1_9ACTN|nr:response regulator transcription factor [Actinomadura latina]NKZ08272.1 response regulator transcription factor [Actinomadura latina]